VFVDRDHVWRLSGAGVLGFQPRIVGSWWDSRDEIDVVAIGDESILLGECKWTRRPVGETVLDDLLRRAQRFRTSTSLPPTRHALFAQSGFTPGLQTRAKEEGVLLASLDDLLADPVR